MCCGELADQIEAKHAIHERPRSAGYDFQREREKKNKGKLKEEGKALVVPLQQKLRRHCPACQCEAEADRVARCAVFWLFNGLRLFFTIYLSDFTSNSA